MTRKHTWPIRLLCLLLVLALAPLQVLAEEWPGMDAFGLPEELPTPPFTDVSVHAWYYPYVRVQHTLGLMAGTGNDAFSPNGTVPLTQGLTVAVRVYEKYLSHFKTQQQTSEWSCGVSSALMVLNWYGKLGDYNEESLAAYRSNGLEPGATSLSQLIEIFQGVGGFDLYSTYDCQDQVHEVFTFDYIQKTLAAGNPIMVGWNDWGGHWQVIIGYDTMGTETTQDDVVIVADPYDTTDHNQDGYGVYSAERFLYNFTFYNFFDDASGELNDMCFLVATPQ